jgi:hypothetical protein
MSRLASAAAYIGTLQSESGMLQSGPGKLFPESRNPPKHRFLPVFRLAEAEMRDFHAFEISGNPGGIQNAVAVKLIRWRDGVGMVFYDLPGKNSSLRL